MNKTETFEQFLTTHSTQVPILDLIINLVLAAMLAYLLSRIYIKYGRSLSNRRSFANNFLLLTVTTMLIITIVKSSLALSLGLVGALSIVRFRSAIKEPEELAYLFLCIGIGLGFGADQRLVTLAAFVFIAGVIVLTQRWHQAEKNQNLHLTITSHNPEKITLDQVITTLKKHCSAVDLKRFDETKEQLEADFQVEFNSFDTLNKSKDELQAINPHVRVTFLDTQGLI